MKRSLTIAASIALGAAALLPLSSQAQTGYRVTIDTAPPAPRIEHVPAARHGYVWAPGHWEWRHGGYHWTRGFWVRERVGYHYAPQAWVQQDGHWVMRPSRWDRHDRDHDGIPNRRDHDRDNDGVPNRADHDRDGDGVRNSQDRHPDNPRRN